MAVLSSVKKYTIKHVNDAGVGVEIPEYPTSVVPSDNLISKSWNTMNGVFRDIPINLKTKVNWVFEAITEEDLEIMYGGMIRDKIVKYNSRFFEINTHFPGVGFIVGVFYLGTPTNFKSLSAEDDGDINWYSGELHWIEVDGIRLNSPTDITPEGGV